MKKIFLIVLTTLGLAACSGNSGLDQFSWLEGTWNGHDMDIYFTETWKKSSDQLMSGNSIVVQTGDTIFKEKLKIEIIGETPCYILTLPEDNEAVIYRLKSTGEKEIAFENTEHAFPQLIVYKMTADSLHVRLEGIREGKKAREEIYYHKK